VQRVRCAPVGAVQGRRARLTGFTASRSTQGPRPSRTSPNGGSPCRRPR
jgi:hypothetical protein